MSQTMAPTVPIMLNTDYFPTSGLTFVSATPSQEATDDSTGIEHRDD